MGNVGGRGDGEGSSGVYDSAAGQGSQQRTMESAQSASSINRNREAPPQSSPLRPRSDLFHAPMTDDDLCSPEKRTPVMVTWTHGGEKVAISGSWDDWRIIEPMQRSGKDFILMKVLPSGIYHFHFVVDGHLRYAPDLPCDFNDPDGAYNIMDVKEYAAETRDSISDFELPPSPIATYSNNALVDGDFSKPPPDLPPQLHRTLLDETGFADSYHESLSRPKLPVLNHLYVKKWDPGEATALGSTQRFLEKYVTVILYKPSWRNM